MINRLLSLIFFTVLSFSLMGQIVVLDFESEPTSTTFQYFGSSLEPTLTSIIDNPDPSGINTSAKVSDFFKPAAAQTWAGAFSNPNPQVAIDLTSNTQVCIKVWFNEPGNLALKLENGSLPNWILQKEVTETHQWVELCFDAADASIEDPMAPAAGGVFSTAVLFFDFGITPDVDRAYYFDDVTLTEGVPEPVDVTFAVDMNEYTGTFTTPYVSGTFNNWAGDANPMTDDDADGIWTTTIEGILTGAHEYKFQLDQWTTQEEFNGYETCTVTDPSGQFVNRSLVLSADTALDTVCYNSCYACGEAVNITINLGQGAIDLSPDGLFIAGGGNFGSPGDFPLDDDDGDGIHTITFEKPIGFESHYTFANGACPDWSCKENIGGQDCADPDNFNDRFMGPIMSDITINTCFGLCTTTTDCSSGSGNVTFSVDMNNYTDPFTTVYVAGNFNDWSGDANPLTDEDEDGIWSATVELVAGNYEYKFELDNWTVSEEFADGDPCTITDPSGSFVNRYLEVDGDAEVCFIWSTCDACDVSNVSEFEITDQLFSINPTLISDGKAHLVFNEEVGESKEVSIVNMVGKVIQRQSVSPGQSTLWLSLESGLANGIYIINVKANNKFQSSRVIISQ